MSSCSARRRLGWIAASLFAAGVALAFVCASRQPRLARRDGRTRLNQARGQLAGTGNPRVAAAIVRELMLDHPEQADPPLRVALAGYLSRREGADSAAAAVEMAAAVQDLLGRVPSFRDPTPADFRRESTRLRLS